MKKRMVWSGLEVTDVSNEEVSFTVTGQGLKTMAGVTDELTVHLEAVVPLKLMVEKFANQVIYALDSFTESKNGELPAKASELFTPFSKGQREFTLQVTSEFPWSGRASKASAPKTAAELGELVTGMAEGEREKFLKELLGQS